MSVAQAAVRRCHRVVLSSVFGLAAFTAAATAYDAANTPAAPLSALSLVIVPVAPALTASDVAAFVPEPKPAEILTASLKADPIPHDEMTCLAEAVYYEARGESIEGQRAVAEVVLRRTKDHRFPSTVCGVVYQGAHKRNACQFSFACDGIGHGRRDRLAWKRAVEVAQYETTGDGRLTDSVSGAQYFHTTRVNPPWAKRFIRTARIGTHIFYRQPGGSYEAEANKANPAS
ncbi:MAG: cell wall hydrolase [Micropepsaceae bacterium]